MGIRLVWTINREVFRIEIVGKEIFYYDRKWEKQIRVIPKDEHFIKKILLSRNKIPMNFIDLFNLTADEQAEYNSANTEEELAEIVVKDCRKKGAVLQKRGGNMNITPEERRKAIEAIVWRLRAAVIEQLKPKPIKIKQGEDDLFFYNKALDNGRV